MAVVNPQLQNVAQLFQQAMQKLADAYALVKKANTYYVKDGLAYGAAGIGGVNLTAGGSGYTAPPTVTFSGGGATAQATATATVVGGAVAVVTMNTPGTGYTSPPAVAFAGGGGTGAAGAAVFLDFMASSLNFIDPTQMGTVITELVAYNNWVDTGTLDAAYKLLPGAG